MKYSIPTNPIHYYSDKLKAKLAIMLTARTTLVEAPSGYGKTTAVRDALAQNLSPSIPVIWFTAQEEHKETAWKRLCHEIEKIDAATGEKLITFGFPNKGNLGMIADALFYINCDMETYLVIDNFHLLQNKLLSGIIQALFGHGGKHLHLIFIRQHGLDEIMPIYDVSCYITATDLCLSEADIYEYYTLSGITFTQEQISSVHAVTEGWVVAVYLQMLSYLETGSFAISSGTIQLMYSLVWNRLTHEEKDFLLRIHTFSGVTVRQACFLLNTSVLPPYAAKLFANNPFIKKSDEHYELHAMLSLLLSEEFEVIDEIRKKEYLMRTAFWHKQSRNTLAALSVFYSLREYDQIFSLDLSLLSFELVGDLPYAVVMSDVVNTCPAEIKRRYPLVLLTIARQLYSMGMEDAYTKLMGELREMVSDTEELFGEWLLVSALPHLREPEQLTQIYSQAASLLSQGSKSINAKEPFRLGSIGPCGMWLRRPGEADETLATVKQALTQYARCAPDHASGQAAILEAELCYLRGQIEKAKILAFKASYIAEKAGKDILLMDASRIMAHIAIHNNDLAAWNNAMDAFVHATAMNPEQERLANAVRELSLSELYCSIGLQEKMTDWIKKGNFNIQTYGTGIYGLTTPYTSSRYFPAFCSANANINHCHYLYRNGQFKKLLGAVDSVIETYERCELLILNIYFELFRAGAYWQLGYRTEAFSSIERVFSLALPDKLYLLLSEFFLIMNKLMKEYLQVRDPEALKEITAISEHFIENWISLYETIDQLCQPAHLSTRTKYTLGYGWKSIEDVLEAKRQTLGLTDREYEIACLTAQGLRNREIAEKLFISPGTVRSHLSVIFQKLQVDRRSMIRSKLL